MSDPKTIQSIKIAPAPGVELIKRSKKAQDKELERLAAVLVDLRKELVEGGKESSKQMLAVQKELTGLLKGKSLPEKKRVLEGIKELMQKLEVGSKGATFSEASNYLYALLKALSEDQTSLSNQQVIDSVTEEGDANRQLAINTYWNNRLTSQADKIEGDAAQGKAGAGQLNADQSVYSTISAEGQAQETQADGLTQRQQQQVSSDADNLKNLIATAGQTANSILSAVSGMLGRITA